jgi:hypothetical protein
MGNDFGTKAQRNSKNTKERPGHSGQKLFVVNSKLVLNPPNGVNRCTVVELYSSMGSDFDTKARRNNKGTNTRGDHAENFWSTAHLRATRLKATHFVGLLFNIELHLNARTKALC